MNCSGDDCMSPLCLEATDVDAGAGGYLHGYKALPQNTIYKGGKSNFNHYGQIYTHNCLFPGHIRILALDLESFPAL